MSSTDNLAESRGKHVRAGRSQYNAGMAGNETDYESGYDRAALSTTRLWTRRGRKQYLDSSR
jgi:hypothetical protein